MRALVVVVAALLTSSSAAFADARVGRYLARTSGPRTPIWIHDKRVPQCGHAADAAFAHMASFVVFDAILVNHEPWASFVASRAWLRHARNAGA